MRPSQDAALRAGSRAVETQRFRGVPSLLEPNQAVVLERLAIAIDRLAVGVERLASVRGSSMAGLAPAPPCGYTRVVEPLSGVADEATMAETLAIPARTLGDYRRANKFPECWVRNGRRVQWNVARTVETWKRGIA
jgi:hypothetical protein